MASVAVCDGELSQSGGVVSCSVPWRYVEESSFGYVPWTDMLTLTDAGLLAVAVWSLWALPWLCREVERALE